VDDFHYLTEADLGPLRHHPDIVHAPRRAILCLDYDLVDIPNVFDQTNPANVDF
jgi:hypothetical protein